jgi:hypothetical protein
MWRVVVRDQENLENLKVKARYRAVKIHPQWVVTPEKQTNKKLIYMKLIISNF